MFLNLTHHKKLHMHAMHMHCIVSETTGLIIMKFSKNTVWVSEKCVVPAKQ